MLLSNDILRIIFVFNIYSLLLISFIIFASRIFFCLLFHSFSFISVFFFNVITIFFRKRSYVFLFFHYFKFSFIPFIIIFILFSNECFILKKSGKLLAFEHIFDNAEYVSYFFFFYYAAKLSHTFLNYHLIFIFSFKESIYFPILSFRSQ